MVLFGFSLCFSCIFHLSWVPSSFFGFLSFFSSDFTFFFGFCVSMMGLLLFLALFVVVYADWKTLPACLPFLMIFYLISN